MESRPEERTVVLLYDLDLPWLNAAERVLRSEGYQVEAVDDDFDRCLELCRGNIYPVMVVNLDSVPDGGQALVELCKTAPHMDLLLTQNDTNPAPLQALRAQGVSTENRFRPKHAHLVTDIPQEVTNLIQRRGRHRLDLELEWPDELEDILEGIARNSPGLYRKTEAAQAVARIKGELEMILRQIFAPRTGQERIAHKVRVEPFRSEGGHSSSELFKVTPTVLLDTDYNKSALLKFGPKEETLQESRNYDRFVEWFLRRDQTVKKIAYSDCKSFAGIVYSFPRDNETGFSKFADCLRKRPTEQCLAVVEAMFSPDNQHWLGVDGNRLLTAHRDKTFQHYYFGEVLASPYEMREIHRQLLFEQMEKLEKSSGDDLFNKGNGEVTFSRLSQTLPDPLDFLTTIPLVDELKMTVVHGDLHADNILVDDQEDRYYFIDFKYTGFGHIFRDFLELELGVRYSLFFSKQQNKELRLASGSGKEVNWEGQKKLMALEKALIKKTVHGSEPQDPALDPKSERYDSTLEKAYQVIKRIRELARENHPEGMRHYFLGLIPTSLRALRYHTYPLDVRLSRYVLAGLYTDLAPKLEKWGL
jgi:hypothetical protein